MTLPTGDRAGGAGLAWPSPPLEARYSLRTVMRPFDVSDATRGTDGLPIAVKLADSTSTHAHDLALCAAVADDIADGAEPTTADWDFQRATAFVNITCDWTDAHAFDSTWWPRVSAKMAAASISRLARRLWFDAPNDGTIYENPSLMTAAVDVTDGTTAAHPLTALARLIESYYEATDTPGDAILHVPQVFASALWNGGGIHVVNGKVVGPLDIPISFGPYTSTIGLDGTTVAPLGTSGYGMIAISGSICAEDSGSVVDPANPDGRIATGEIIQGRHEGRQNANSVIAEVANIYAFDVSTVFACRTFVPAPASANSE